MIKRRFYKHEHDDGNDPSDSSSSSSDSELEAEDIEESEDDVAAAGKEDAQSDESEEDAVAEVKEDAESEESDDDDDDAVAGVKGYESEDSSAHEVDSDSSGQLLNEDDETGNDSKNLKHGTNVLEPPNISAEMDSPPVDLPPYILLRKKVYRCRICPRVICLSEDFLRAHLKSKKHVRSEKLLNEGKLKSILNDDLEIENQETPAELHARIMALPQTNSKRKNKGRQRQKKRSIKKKTEDDSKPEKAKKPTKSPAKKRRKKEN